MPKLDHLIEGLLLPVISLTALLLALADVFGFAPLVPPGHIPALTLSIVSLILTTLIVIQRRGVETHKLTQLLSEKITLEQLDEKSLELIDFELLKLVGYDFFLLICPKMQITFAKSFSEV